MKIPNLALTNGVKIPQIGFGTYKVTKNAEQVVANALNAGYRHIDAAQMYGNEPETGRAISGSGVAREDLFITSKLDNPNHLQPQASISFAQTLLDLQVDYVDLFLIHWPLPMHYGGDFAATWRILEGFYEQGRARAIGLSNFEPEHLRVILDNCRIIPQVNQVESHPYLPNREVHDFAAAQGIVTEAWSPLARGRAVSDPLLAEIGLAHGKSASQVALRWALQRGDVIFPKASTLERQQQNLQVFDFNLSDEEIALVNSLDRGPGGRTGSHPRTKGI